VKLRQPFSQSQFEGSDSASRTAGQVIAQRWWKGLEAMIESQRLASGLEYAQAGQIVDLEIRPGLVDAHVQGRAGRPYHTQLRVVALTPDQWDHVVQAMLTEAVYAAKLLAGELPTGFDDLMSSMIDPQWLRIAAWSQPHPEISVAGPSMQLRSSCTCDDDQPCKHLAAAGFVVTERLLEQPMLIMTLLGMPADRVLEQLKRTRSIQSRGMTSAHAEALAPESRVQAPPLEACIEDFWRNPPGSAELADLENQPPLEHVPHALLRRLGPSPLNGRFPMVGLLASVYDAVSAAAKNLRDSGTSLVDAIPSDSAEPPGH